MDRDDLRSRLGACLSFAIRTLRQASPENDLWAVDLGQVSGFDKMTLEAGVLALISDRSGCCSSLVEDLLVALREAFDSERALTYITRYPATATTLGTTLIVLDQFGMLTPREQSVLYRALESPYMDSSERVPFRLLDRQWVLYIAGRATLDMEAVLNLSLPLRVTHPIYMTREDAYALTHAVMYSTDFGRRRPPAPLGRIGLGEMVDACLAWCASVEDFDLVAELLIAQLYLDDRLSQYGTIAWEMMRRAWDNLGFPPSPSLSADDFQSLADVEAQRQYAFYHMYHTIFVAGLCCTALLGSSNAGSSSRSVTASPGGPEAAYQINGALIESSMRRLRNQLHVIPADLATFSWTADLTSLDAATERFSGLDGLGDEDVCRRMALDGYLIEKARAYDLAGLAGGLRASSATAQSSPTEIVAAGFLAQQLPLDGATLDGRATGSAAIDVTKALGAAIRLVQENLARADLPGPGTGTKEPGS